MRLSTVDIMLTNKCNLRCAFCYIGQHKQDETTVEDEIKRNISTCEWIVKQYRDQSKDLKNARINLNLYGGEPTVAWDSVKALAAWRDGVKDIQVQMGLVTNMVLMDEAKIDWCIANKVGIHPSIDGCQEVEDMFRLTADKQTVSDKVFANAKVLTKKLPYRSCRSTICPETVSYAFKSIKFLTEEIGFTTVNQVMAGGVNWTDESIAALKNQLTLTTDWWLDSMRKGKHYSLYYLRNMLTGIWNPIRQRGLCSSGCSHAAIDTDGNLYPCHRFCGPTTTEEYKMGSIHTGGPNNKVLEDKLRAFDLASFHKDKCSKCIAVNSCMALCLHEMMLAGNGMFEPCEHYCKIWPFYYSEAMRAHAIMDAEKNQLYYNTYRPRPQVPQNNIQQQLNQVQSLLNSIQTQIRK